MTEEIQEQEIQEPQPVPPELESEARTMGWVPKDEFRGSPDNWRSADEYVRRGREMIPIMRSQMGKYEGEIQNLKSTVETQKASIDKLIQMSEKVSQQAYDRAKAELTAQQAAAIADGDAERWKMLETEKDKLVRPEPITVNQPPQVNPAFTQWHTNNDWYMKDPELTEFANIYGETIKKTNPGVAADYNKWLSTIESRVKATFPERFTNPNRNTPPPVDTPSQHSTVTNTGKKTYNDLPGDAKAQCDIWVKDGTFKSREDYVKSYFEEEPV